MEFDKLVAFAKENAIDLTIIGMDDPLVGGVVDAFESEGLRVFGPRKNAAIIEGSKAFSKDLMKKYKIPTAAYENFTDPDAAIKYLETEAKFPIVLKADGLALGKGVLICNTLEEAKDGVKEIMLDKKFGSAGNEMVIEEFMTGREVSVLSFVDGKTIRTMTSAQDHKRAMDGDKGLNTGGMGTFSPSPFYTKEVDEFCKQHVYQATVDAMAAEGRPFVGIIFFGLMLSCLVRYRENVMLLVVFTSVPLLFMTGISWPQSNIPAFWQGFAWVFPSTFGIRGFLRISSMGASLADILPEFRALWIQTGVYFLATCLVFRQQLRSARLKANLTAEVAEEEDEAEELLEAKK